jgi:hypothetical protein
MSVARTPGWEPFRTGTTLGEAGSEAGVILRDEEHVDGARITLERIETTNVFRPVVRCAITCGIYDWMVHTRFFSSEEEAVQAYDVMKPELTSILDNVPMLTDPQLETKQNDVKEKILDFIERFP